MIDLTGQIFGCIEVIKDSGKKYDNGQRLWECRCTKCGKTKLCGTNNIKNFSGDKGCHCTRTQFLSRQESHEIVKRSRGTVDSTQAVTLTSKIRCDNTSGVKGVYWSPAGQKWYVRIGFKGTTYHLGHYADKEDAIRVRKEAEKLHFEPFLEAYRAGAFNTDTPTETCHKE